MNERQRKRIDEKVSFWDQMKTSLTSAGPLERDKALSDIADRNEEEERRRKAADSAAIKPTRDQGGQS